MENDPSSFLFTKKTEKNFNLMRTSHLSHYLITAACPFLLYVAVISLEMSGIGL